MEWSNIRQNIIQLLNELADVVADESHADDTVLLSYLNRTSEILNSDLKDRFDGIISSVSTKILYYNFMITFKLERFSDAKLILPKLILQVNKLPNTEVDKETIAKMVLVRSLSISSALNEYKNVIKYGKSFIKKFSPMLDIELYPVNMEMGGAFLTLGIKNRATRLFNEILEGIKFVPKYDLYFFIGNKYFECNYLFEANRAFNNSVYLLEREYEIIPPFHFNKQIQYAITEDHLGRIDSAISILQNLWNRSEEIEEAEIKAQVSKIFGNLLYEKGDFEQASILFKTSMLIYETDLEINNSDNSNMLREYTDLRSNLAIIDYHSGEYPRALEIFQSALSSYEKIDYKLGISRTLRNIGNCLVFMDETKQAYGYSLEARNVIGQIENPSHLDYQEYSMVLQSLINFEFLSGSNAETIMKYIEEMGDIYEITNNDRIGLIYNFTKAQFFILSPKLSDTRLAIDMMYDIVKNPSSSYQNKIYAQFSVCYGLLRVLEMHYDLEIKYQLQLELIHLIKTYLQHKEDHTLKKGYNFILESYILYLFNDGDVQGLSELKETSKESISSNVLLLLDDLINKLRKTDLLEFSHDESTPHALMQLMRESIEAIVQESETGIISKLSDNQEKSTLERTEIRNALNSVLENQKLIISNQEQLKSGMNVLFESIIKLQDSASEQIMLNIENNLSSDELSKTLSDKIADQIRRFIRKINNKELIDINGIEQNLIHQYGQDFWNGLHYLSRDDLLAAEYIANLQSSPLKLDLAILLLAKIVEREVGDKVFNRFKEHIFDPQYSKLSIIEPDQSVNPFHVTTLHIFRTYLENNKPLTLGNYPKIAVSSNRHPNLVYFADFLNYVNNNFNDPNNVLTFIQDLDKEHFEIENLIDQSVRKISLLQLRNYCAHPKEFHPIKPTSFTQEILDAVKTFSFEQYPNLSVVVH